MRPKELQCLVTFKTTTEAMAFEKIAKKSGLKGRLIPIPSILASGCGLAWRENPENRVLIDNIFEQYKIGFNKIYEIEI
ncbi:MAG: DUF3343 domain-containing protein [Tissierellia bacterium]|nr:DUF3343 domain-containing protein [Tissierellia bacterium]